MIRTVLPAEKRAIWEKLSAFEIGDPNAPLSFSRRLARENAWPADYAERVVLEYKRFLLLVKLSSQELTPSDQVDQAWHLHLSYTQSYWNDLCENLLECELHHLPTRGGASENDRFHEQYRHTLGFYREIFAEAPPEDIWPPAHIRFRDTDRFARINRANSWVIRKPGIFSVKFAAFALLPLILVSCTDILGETDIWFWLKVALGLFVLYKIFSWLDSGGKGGSGGSGCGAACGGCGGGD